MNIKNVDGVTYVCHGEHERHEDCQWEPLASDKSVNTIDLYDTPIDLRPRKPDLLRDVISYLRDHGDHYGAGLIESGFVGSDPHVEENSETSERSREEAS